MSDEYLKNGVGRPNKKGLDYFAHLVKHSDEENILFKKYGCSGYAVFYYLREKITENGYYYELTDRKILLLCSDLQIEDRTLFDEILSFIIELELFDRLLFDEYRILSSERLQLDYIIAASRRTKIDFIQEYYLISDDTFYREISDSRIQNKLHIYSISDNRNSINVNRNKQSKSNSKNESKSKEEKKKEIEILKENGKGNIKGSIEGEQREKPQIDGLTDEQYNALFRK